MSQAIHCNQAIAQSELNTYIEQQAEAIAPEIRVVEISFYDHEIYSGDNQIATITYDHNDFVTQPWVVMVGETEVHRANTWAKCHSFITWHYKQGTLPVFNTPALTPTNNQVMAQIAAECERFGLKLQSDGIYQGDVKLGEVGCTEGRWWVLRTSSQHQQPVPCDDVFDAVWSLLIDAPLVLLNLHPLNNELLDKPFDELTTAEWESLKEGELHESQMVAA